MRIHSKLLLFPALVVLGAAPMVGSAGIFPPPAGQSGSQAVAAGSTEIDGWATGYEAYAVGPGVDAGFRTPLKALGEAGNSDGTQQGAQFDVVTLGRGGSITLSFSPPIADGPGPDFAVFENSFDDTFLEFAKVEVSSDGQHFVPFAALSTVPAPVGSFGNVDATDVEQLAGKYRGGYGTPFDLSLLPASGNLNTQQVRYVRLTDVVGDGSVANDLTPQTLARWLGVTVGQLPQALVDVANNAPAAIYDPYITVGSAGFDLDAVAVMQQGEVPAAIDIDPWNANPIDPESTATLPVIVYSSSLANGDLDDFDATRIDSSSVEFGYFDAAPVAGPFSFDWDADGLVDAGYQFQIQDTGIACEDTQASLRGATLDGIEFAGTSAITTAGCATASCHP